MSEWWTYRLSDFLLFSADTYYRLFELYNRAIWPAHVLVAAISIWAAFLLFRPRRWSRRILFFILAAGWLWVAWGYHVTHFSTINWAAPYFAAGFALEGFLLLLAGGFNTNSQRSQAANRSRQIGIGLAGFGLIIQPLIGPLTGRPWTQVEIVGLTPDPTAIVTLGLILMVGRFRWMLLPVPIIWCIISGATLWTMGMAAFWVMPAAALITLALLAIRSRRFEGPANGTTSE